jgi:hypothetical protein
MPLPWAALLRHGPAIVSAAQALFATQSRKVNDRQQGIEARLEQLEKASVESARLLQEIAQQVQTLTLAEQELQKRVQLALILAGVGIGAGVIAIVLVFVT